MTGVIEGFLGGLKFFIPVFFRVGKFSKYFLGWLDFRMDFWGY